MNVTPKQVEINGTSYFTKKGAAETLGVSPITLVRETNRKNITYLLHPRYGLCFTQENLDEWIQRRTTHMR